MVKHESRPLIRYDWKLISNQEDSIRHCEKISQKIDVSFTHHANDEEFLKIYHFSYKPNLIVMDGFSSGTDESILNRARKLKARVKKVPLCLLIPDESPSQSSVFLSEFDYVFRKSNFLSELFEYFVFLKTKGEIFSVSIQDLFPSTVIPFNVYQITDISKKILPVIFHRLPLMEKKFAALQNSTKPLVIRRPDVMTYRNYIENFFDQSPFGSKKRIRAHLIEFLAYYFDLKTSLWISPGAEGFENKFKSYSLSLHQIMIALLELKDPWGALIDISMHDFLKYEKTWFPLLGTLLSFQRLGQESQVQKFVNIGPFMQSFEGRSLTDSEWNLLAEGERDLVKEYLYSSNIEQTIPLGYFKLMQNLFAEIHNEKFSTAELMKKYFSEQMLKQAQISSEEPFKNFVVEVSKSFFEIDSKAA